MILDVKTSASVTVHQHEERQPAELSRNKTVWKLFILFYDFTVSSSIIFNVFVLRCFPRQLNGCLRHTKILLF